MGRKVMGCGQGGYGVREDGGDGCGVREEGRDCGEGWMWYVRDEVVWGMGCPYHSHSLTTVSASHLQFRWGN